MFHVERLVLILGNESSAPVAWAGSATGQSEVPRSITAASGRLVEVAMFHVERLVLILGNESSTLARLGGLGDRSVRSPALDHCGERPVSRSRDVPRGTSGADPQRPISPKVPRGRSTRCSPSATIPRSISPHRLPTGTSTG